MKAFVSAKNFVLGHEWIWPKNKFLDRKALFFELYMDYMDDGIINRQKFLVGLI